MKPQRSRRLVGLCGVLIVVASFLPWWTHRTHAESLWFHLTRAGGESFFLILAAAELVVLARAVLLVVMAVREVGGEFVPPAARIGVIPALLLSFLYGFVFGTIYRSRLTMGAFG